MANARAVTKMLEQAPLPEMIRNLGTAIAEAQLALDRVSIGTVQAMADTKITLPDETEHSMLELGLTPSFYHFTEATISARVAFSAAESQSFSFGAEIGGGYKGIFYASVNASYSQRYSFNAEGSSEVRTTLVSLPPPAPLNELIARLVATSRDRE